MLLLAVPFVKGRCNLRNDGTKADWTVHPYGSVIGR